MATPKQEKLIKLLLENVGTKGNTKTLGEMLREAGYEESIAKNPYRILGSETVQEGISDVVGAMEKERNRALAALASKNLDEVGYEKITDVIDKLTKNIQLLGGKPTEITQNDYSELSDEQLTRIAKGKSGVSEKRAGKKAS